MAARARTDCSGQMIASYEKVFRQRSSASHIDATLVGGVLVGAPDPAVPVVDSDRGQVAAAEPDAGLRSHCVSNLRTSCSCGGDLLGQQLEHSPASTAPSRPPMPGMMTRQGGAGEAGPMSDGLSGLVNRVIAWADRLQRRHGVLGFPYAVVKKYGDDEGGRQAALIT